MFCIVESDVHPMRSLIGFIGCSFPGLMPGYMGWDSDLTWVSIAEKNGMLGEQTLRKRTIDFASAIEQMFRWKTASPRGFFHVVSLFSFGALSVLNRHQKGQIAIAASVAINGVLVRAIRLLLGARKAIVELYHSIKFDGFDCSALSQTNLLPHIPNRLKPLHSQSLLNVFRRNGSGGHHQKHTVIPRFKLQLAVHHNLTASNSRFSTAIHAFPAVHGAEPAQSFRPTFSANKAVLFALSLPVNYACRVMWKLFKEVFRFYKYRIFSKNLPLARNRSMHNTHAGTQL